MSAVVAPHPTSARAMSSVAIPRLDALFLTNNLGLGGSERKIVRVCNTLQERGCSTGLAMLNGPETLAELLSERVPRWRLEREGKFSFAAARRLARLLERSSAHVVFAVNLYPSLYAATAAMLLGRRAPALVGLVNTTEFGRGDRWQQPFYKQVLRTFDAVIYGCELQRDSWLGGREGARRRSLVMYNGVDLDEFDPERTRHLRLAERHRYGISADAFVIGNVGRLIPAKNQAVLIDAAARLAHRGCNVHLVLAGEGPLRDELERRAEQAGLGSRVRFLGLLRDVRPVLAMMDVFVLPSLYIETFSNAALEAMAMRKCVVLSAVGGAAEMIRDGVEGRILAPHALEAQLPELLEQLANDRALLAAMANRARERVEALFSFNGMVDGYESIIRRFGR